MAAQGFHRPRPIATPTMRHVQGVIDKIGLLQIDSVNVLSRSHYLPLFSRLGDYDRGILDRAATAPRRRLVEYWAHEASLIPPETYRLLYWRMHAWRETAWGRMRGDSPEWEALLEDVYAAVRDTGPVTASRLNTRLDHGVPEDAGDNWGWNWSQVKTALEALFWSGRIGSAGRTAQFERRYELTERILPPEVAAAEPPARPDAIRQLTLIAARALGIASPRCLSDYFRMPVKDTKTAIEELVTSGELLPAAVPSWSNDLYLHVDAARPRRVRARALLSPFDSLVFERRRTEDLFDFRYRIEIYTPKHQRRYGYYVLPFLLGERIVARLDIKADRRAGSLLVRSAHPEPCAPADTAAELADELTLMAGWLGLAGVRVESDGPLAREIAARL
nr:crosslink repair DNA glycosylase YcaQ family protein [Spelaeicoccus albus]